MYRLRALTAHELQDSKAEAREQIQQLMRRHAPELGVSPAPAEPGPCDGCATRSRCAEQGLACEAFALFVNVAHSIRRWRLAPRQASKIVYDRLFPKAR